MVRICMEYWRNLWFVGLRRDFLEKKKKWKKKSNNNSNNTTEVVYLYRKLTTDMLLFSTLVLIFVLALTALPDGITRCFRLILHLPLTPTCFLLFSVKYTFISGKIFYYIMETIRGKKIYIEGMLMWYEILFLFSLRLPISIL